MQAFTFGLPANNHGLMLESGNDTTNGVFAPHYNDSGVLVELLNCTVMWGRQGVSFGTLDVPGGDGVLCLVIKHPARYQRYGVSSLTATLGYEFGKSNDDQTAVPIYSIKDGQITGDYRNTPVVLVYN